MKRLAVPVDARVTELHSVMPIESLPFVLEHGLLSRERAAALTRGPHDTIVSDCRDVRRVPRGLRLCQYASLHFRASTSTLFRLEGAAADLCVLRVSADVLALPGAVITDCDAESDYVRFLSPLQQDALDFDDVYGVGPGRGDSPIRAFQHRLRECAEALVPHGVKPRHLLGAYVFNGRAAELLAGTGFKRPIEVEPGLFPSAQGEDQESDAAVVGVPLPAHVRLSSPDEATTPRNWNNSWVILMEVLRSIEAQPYASPMGRTAFHEMCYVATRMGLPTGFDFREGSYGPFSVDARRVLRAFAALDWIKERIEGRTLALQVRAQYDRDRHRFAGVIREHREQIVRMVDLFSRIRTSEQAVEVASVLFAARQLEDLQAAGDVAEEEVLDYVLHWGKRSRSCEQRKALAATIRNLVAMGWLRATFSESMAVA